MYSRDPSAFLSARRHKGLAADHAKPCAGKITEKYTEKRSRQPHGGDKYILFSGIGELVLSAAVVGLLDPWVRPQCFDGYHVRLVKAADLLNVHLLHQHGVILKKPEAQL